MKNITKGHNWGPFLLDPVGLFYIIFTVVYCVVIVVGLSLLWTKRGSVAVRLRSFWMICATVLVLQFYNCSVLLQYPFNGTYKCGEGFWIMSIVLPGGIALFQASNIRMLTYYEEQQHLASGKPPAELPTRPPGWLRTKWRRLNAVEKTYLGIVVGGVCQLILSLILFFGSRRFHKGYGFFGTYVSAGACRRGLEWIPSAFWQFLWSAIFGPYVLLRIRGINDTHYWAWQTRLAIIACLPGTPIWLGLQYTHNPAVLKVNKWFVPPMWFLPGLMTIQFVSIFFPIYDAYKTKSVCKSIASISSTDPQHNASTTSLNPLGYLTETNNPSNAFDRQIEHDIEGLLQWAARKDLTAENIVFLRSVRDYKRKWSALSERGLSAKRAQERYNEAAVIYFTLINPNTSRFNINIDHRTYMEVHALFKGLRYSHYSDDETSTITSGYSDKSGHLATPWDDVEMKSGLNFPPAVGQGDAERHSNVGRDSRAQQSLRLSTTDSATLNSTATGSHGAANSPRVPAEFNTNCFDKAFNVVYWDVYSNTWMRYQASLLPPAPKESTTNFGHGDTSRSRSSGCMPKLWRKRGSPESHHAPQHDESRGQNLV